MKFHADGVTNATRCTTIFETNDTKHVSPSVSFSHTFFSLPSFLSRPLPSSSSTSLGYLYDA